MLSGVNGIQCNLSTRAETNFSASKINGAVSSDISYSNIQNINHRLLKALIQVLNPRDPKTYHKPLGPYFPLQLLGLSLSFPLALRTRPSSLLPFLYRTTLIDFQPPSCNITHQSQAHRGRHDSRADYGLKD